MYQPNQIVECDEKYGRVIYHDQKTHDVHVMFRTSTNTWKIEKCNELFCKPAQVFLWTIESAFSSKYLRTTRTPQFESVQVNQDHILEI